MSGLHSQSGLAHALDVALANRGSAPTAEGDVADLVDLARAIEEGAAHVRPSDEFRARSAQRLRMHMARSARQQPGLHPTVADRARIWAIRFVAGLGALTLAGAAAASASASALPGDALYPVKQVTEAAALQLAPTDSARQSILLHQADTRLDETARLIQQGRDGDAATTAAQYEQTLAALPDDSSSQSLEPELSRNQARLSELLQTAPLPARPGLERALAASERHSKPTVQNETAAPAAATTPAAARGQQTEPLDMRSSAAVDPPPASQAEPTPITVEPLANAPESEESHPAPHADTKPGTSSADKASRGSKPANTIQPPSRRSRP